MSNINVNTITPLAGTSGTVSVSGSLLVSGNITAQGNLTFGNQDTDSVAFGAEISSSITPDANNTYSLGSAAKQWKTIFAETASFNQIISSGSTMMILTSASISYLSGSSPIVIASALNPDVTNTHDIGAAGLEFKDLWIDGNANIDTLTNTSGSTPVDYNVQVSASLVPAVNTVWDLGTTSKEWKDLYIDGTAFIDTVGNQTDDVLISASLTPNASNTYLFGSTAKQWKHIAAVSSSFSHKVGIGSTINPAEALTVVGNISASGTITGSRIGAAGALQAMTGSFGVQSSVTTNTAGNVIYAHGNISASGATMAATASFGAPTTVTTNLAGTPLYVHGNISASNVVYAQTMSIANGDTNSGVQLSVLGNISASGFVSASNVGAAIGTFTNITASANISTSIATSKLSVPSASITHKLGVGTSVNPAEALTVQGNMSASGTASVEGLGVNTGIANVTAGTISGSGYNLTAQQITGNSGSLQSLAVNTSTNIAPGTISGSGYNLTAQQITGLSGSFTGLAVNTAANVTVGTISGSGFNLNSTTITVSSGAFDHVAGQLSTVAQPNVTTLVGTTAIGTSGAATTFAGTVNIDEAVTLDTTLGVTGISTLTGGVVYGTETKTIGALTPAIPVTFITIDGTKAYALANGATAGTIKHISVKTVANTPAGTLTPNATAGAWATAAFSVVGQTLTLLWDGAGWAIIGRGAGVAAATGVVAGLPVIAE